MKNYTTTKEEKSLIKKLIKELNNAGFTGGLYYYKTGECSCCYGLEDVFFQINGNIPDNWNIYKTGKFYYKITYDIIDKKQSDKFRKLANKLSKEIFVGYKIDTARSINKSIIINIKN